MPDKDDRDSSQEGYEWRFKRAEESAEAQDTRAGEAGKQAKEGKQSKRSRDRYEEAWRKYRREMRRFKREQRTRVITIPWGKLSIAVGVIVVVGIAFLLATTLPLAAPPQGEEPKAPNFALTTYNGTDFTLSEFEGSVVLLDFMSTTCTPCIEEVYDIKIVRDTYPGEFVIISISVARESDETLRAFAELHGIDWLLAADTAEQNVAGKYGIRYTPTLFILDQQRRIAYTHVGRTPAEVLSEEIGGLLGSSRGAGGVERSIVEWSAVPSFTSCIPMLVESGPVGYYR